MKRTWHIIADLLAIAVLVIDLFCGAGGTTTGFENSQVNGKKVVKVIACVNHDANAIRSHSENHPETVHFTEDIRTQAIQPIAEVVEQWKGLCPNAVVVLWASLECTHHSNAKGGESRDADSRSLAEHLDRYYLVINPDYIWIENVNEFRKWGPLVQKVEKSGNLVFHKDKTTGLQVPTMVPDKTQLCIYFQQWINDTCAAGYTYADVSLNAANFNAHQNRQRYFGSFARTGREHIFPVPFTKKGRAVKEVLNFEIEGESIFDPNRVKAITSPKTIDRLYAGVKRFVVPDREAWLVKYNQHGDGTAHPGKSVDDECPTVCARRTLGKASVTFLSKYYGGNNHNISINGPAGTITNIDHHGMASCHFLMLYYSNGLNKDTIERPVSALGTKDRVQVCKTYFLDNQYGMSKPTSVEASAGSATVNPKQGLYTAYLMNTNYNRVGSSIEKESPALQASRRYYYLVDSQFANPGTSIEKPSGTIIAAQDKKPKCLAESNTLEGYRRIIIRETNNPDARPVHIFHTGTVVYNLPGDQLLKQGASQRRVSGKKKKTTYLKRSPAYYASLRKLLVLMAETGIIDLKMRMLMVEELLKIQGFPADYKLKGTESDKKKYIGNAVYTGIPKNWGEVAARKLNPYLKAA